MFAERYCVDMIGEQYMHISDKTTDYVSFLCQTEPFEFFAVVLPLVNYTEIYLPKPLSLSDHKLGDLATGANLLI